MIEVKEFERLYNETNGFLPEQSLNYPLLYEDGESTYYKDLAEDCSLFMENNTGFFNSE